jgi:uncharacterized protein with NRDE domain
VCTLAIYFHASKDFPVVVAANRDEFFDRPTAAPAALVDTPVAAVPPARTPWVVAGRDLRAGGTWLGVNAHHLVAGLLNRRSANPPDPERRSRGLLCLEALQERSVAAARERVLHDPGTRYNLFNLLLAAPDAACVIGNSSGAMATTLLDPGLHLLTNLELNDPECPRIAKSYGLFDALRGLLAEPTADEFLRHLRGILSDHSTPLDPRDEGPPNNLCVHTPDFGTRSSTVLLYAARARRFRLWHAAGPPCETEYTEIVLPPQ